MTRMIYAVRKQQSDEVEYVSAKTDYKARECAGRGSAKGWEVIGMFTVAHYEENVRRIQAAMKQLVKKALEKEGK